MPSVTYRVKHVRDPEEISALLVRGAGNWRPANAIPSVRKDSSNRTLVVKNVITIAARVKVSYNLLVAVDRLNLRFLLQRENICFRRRPARMHFLSTSFDVGRRIVYGVLRGTILRFFNSALQKLPF